MAENIGLMSEILQAVHAARLLGRWILIGERHAGGCSCCPGLGEVSIGEIEGTVLAWLRERHPVIAERGGVARILRDCIERKVQLDAAFFQDLSEALGHLERVQSGLG